MFTIERSSLEILHVKCNIYFFNLDFSSCHVEAKNGLASSSVGTEGAGGLKADEKRLSIRASSQELSQPILLLPSDVHTLGIKQWLKRFAFGCHKPSARIKGKCRKAVKAFQNGQ